MSAEWKLYYNPQCSKCREALALLSEQGIAMEVIEYLKTPPSKEDLETLAAQVDSLPALVRIKDEKFTQEPFDVNSKQTVIANLLKHPSLLERPILQGKGKAVIGRPVEKILQFLQS